MQSVERLDEVLSVVGGLILQYLFGPVVGLVERLFPKWWEFLQRPRPLTTTTGMDALGLERFLYESAFWIVLFSTLFLAVPRLSKALAPKWYDSLQKGHRRDLPSYAVCMVHHFYLVPRSWYRIWIDYNLPASMWAMRDYGPLEAIVSPFCIGYLVADSICYAIPNFSVEYIIHHVLTISIVLAGVNSNNYIGRFIPHLLVSDTTQLLYNTSWLLKRVGGFSESSPVCMTLELLFAVIFPCVRIFVMPMAFLCISLNGANKDFGLARFVFLPLCLLQYYWFSLICRRLVGILSGSKPPSKKKSE